MWQLREGAAGYRRYHGHHCKHGTVGHQWSGSGGQQGSGDRIGGGAVAAATIPGGTCMGIPVAQEAGSSRETS